MAQYELLIPLDDITHASITRDVAPPRRSVCVCVCVYVCVCFIFLVPLLRKGKFLSLMFVRRQPFSSPRRQSSLKTPTLLPNVAMDKQDSATPTQSPLTPEKDLNTSQMNNDEVMAKEGEKEVDPTTSELDSARESDALEVVPNRNKEKSAAVKFTSERGGMERSPAVTVSDTDAESDRESMPTVAASGVSESPAGEGEEGKREGEEGEREDGEGAEGEREDGEGERENEAIERSETTAEEETRKENREKDEREETGDSRPKKGDDVMDLSNMNGGDLSGSTDDLLAIMGSGEAVESRPHAVSQCSMISLDGILGDASYFLHFRVISKSGQRLVRADWLLWLG